MNKNLYDPNKTVDEMSYAEQREHRKSRRAKEYAEEQKVKLSKLAKVRENNRQPITNEETARRSLGTQNGKFITQALKDYLLCDDDRLKKYVKKMYENALNGNASMVLEINNRVEGKLKEQIDLTTRLTDIAPSQEESEALDNRFALKMVKPDQEQISDVMRSNVKHKQYKRHGALLRIADEEADET